MERILHTGMTSGLGGIETYLMNYYRNIDHKALQFDFVNIYGEHSFVFEEEINRMGGKIFNLPSYYRHPIKYIKELKLIIEKNNYNVVHCNMNSAVMIFPLIAAKLSNVKVIIAHSHNSSSDSGLLKEFLHMINKHFIPFLANYYFACSSKAGQWFFSKKILASDKFLKINNAVDGCKFKFKPNIRNRVRESLNLTNKMVIGHIGRFSKQKNHEFLIDIFYEIIKQNKDAILVLIGKGEYEETIRNKVKSLNLDKHVKFLGIRDDVNEIMQAMDIFIMPSLYEGLPVVGIEAQASGIHCIMSENITKETKVLKETEFISLEKSAKEWANIILKSHESYIRKDRFQDLLKSHFDIKMEAKKLEQFYFTKINEVK